MNLEQYIKDNKDRIKWITLTTTFHEGEGIINKTIPESYVWRISNIDCQSDYIEIEATFIHEPHRKVTQAVKYEQIAEVLLREKKCAE